MGELTANVPKPMKEVGGKPILQHIVEGLRDEAGIRDIFIVTGWCGHVIRDHFSDGERWKVNITYGEQVVQDGTGKAPELAKDWLGRDRFLFTYGDILLDPPTDYKRLADACRESGVIAVKDGEDLTKGGAVVLDQEGFMIDLVEKGSGPPPPNAYYNAGIYVLPSDIFQFTAKLEKSPRGEYEFTDALKAFVKAGAQLRGVTLRSSWADVRDPGVLAELNQRANPRVTPMQTNEPLPPFNGHGYLPAGVHETTFDQLHERLVTNPQRTILWQRLQEFLEWVISTGKFSHVYIDGGFITDKASPEDIDVILQIREPYGTEALRAMEPFFKKGFEAIRSKYSVDLHFWCEGFPDDMNDFRRFFQYIRPQEAAPIGLKEGARKGLARIKL